MLRMHRNLVAALRGQLPKSVQTQSTRLYYESSSAKIFKESRANKVGLSYALDGSLRSGEHDMKVFGLGFLRTVSTRQEFANITASMYFFYKAMEVEFDAFVASEASKSSQGNMKTVANGGASVSRVWREFPELRRAPRLQQDYEGLGLDIDSAVASPATLRYVQRIHEVAKQEPALLLGHFYCRYFADLFGGSMLGYPTKIALALNGIPAFYQFDPSVETNRQQYIERVYALLNEEGDTLNEGLRNAIVAEAITAFRHNQDIFLEQPGQVDKREALDYGHKLIEWSEGVEKNGTMKDAWQEDREASKTSAQEQREYMIARASARAARIDEATDRHIRAVVSSTRSGCTVNDPYEVLTF
ncbi:hypothetical protein CYMTET_15133 [Cymbomonas tetramitiformis]|uniref:Heme oxygenase n=1 Tax=Cymbomonas tetramitiformis TaxID=36881 RepID=A0AAE0GEW7_9CHLO|nr:hypothetical protein CYMTET_15133 [Cymbomonas tetramitiformis]